MVLDSRGDPKAFIRGREDPSPWEVSGEAVLLETSHFQVRVEHCRLPDGAPLDYYLLDASDWVNVLAVTQDLELLLVRQYRHATRAETLEIPAGGCRPGETPIEAGVRELLEETGHGGPARLIRSRKVNPALLTNTLHTVLIYPAVHITEPEHSALETTTPELISPEQWLTPGFAISLDHLFTALAVHELSDLLAPVDPTDRAAARAALTASIQSKTEEEGMAVDKVYARAAWTGRLEDELTFWEGALTGETDYLRWRLDQMLSPEGRLAKFPVRLLPHLEEFVARHGTAPRILDIGSGPLSTLGWAAERGLATVVAVDPLAERYAALMAKHGYSYPVTPTPGTGEQIGSMFEAASFDMVYSRNALDHCISPHQVLREAVRVLRPDGVLFLEGAVAEGTQQQWHGLHQHDILPTADDMLHRDRNGTVTSLVAELRLHRLFSGSGQGAAEPAHEWEQNDWYVLSFRKLPQQESTNV